MSEKRCNDCGEAKPRTEFYRSARQHDGLSTYCKVCTKARVYAYRATNPERAKETAKRYREKHAEEILERHRAYVRSPEYSAKRKACRAANPDQREKQRLRSKAWRDRLQGEERKTYIRQKNAKKTTEQRRLERQRYEARHPEKRAVYDARKHAKRRLAPIVDDVDRFYVWERDGGTCGICGELADPADWHLDHIIPLARGGEHSYANVQVSHPLCNDRKGARMEAAA